MTTRRLALLIILAAIGYAGFFFLFQRANPAAGWSFELDRATAIARARAAAASRNITVSDASESVSVNYNRMIEYYLAKQPEPLLGSLLTPASAIVQFTDRRSRGKLEIRLNSRGELLGFRRQDPPAKPAQPGNQSVQIPAGSIAGDQKIAEESLRGLLGEGVDSLSFLSASDAGKDGRKFSWSASDDVVRILSDVTVLDGTVRELWLQWSLTPEHQAIFASRQAGTIILLTGADNIVIWPAIVLVIIIFFVGLARRQIDHRKSLVFFGICLLLILSTNSLGSFGEGFSSNIRISGASSIPPAIEKAIVWLVYLILNIFLAFSLYIFFASGLSVSQGLANRRSIDMELLLSGKLLKRPVTGSILAGLMAGGLFLLILHATAATGLFDDAMINASGIEKAFGAKLPAADAFFSIGQLIIFMSFAFLIPCIEAYVKRLPAARLLEFTAVFLSIMGARWFSVSWEALIVTSFLQALLLVWLYRNFGLLAIIIATIASQAAVTSASLLAQNSAALQTSGRGLAVFLGSAAVVGLIGYWKSSDPSRDELAAKRPAEDRAERERLQAEFSVARRAQQHMLPDTPPEVPGIALSAICQPSKEVGGDLYDFLELRDGKVGIVVADVSGKGVPASLYMTLTKGLLDSVIETDSDPGRILSEVNRHLYEVCRRKMFVTMFLGVYDPRAKTLNYARAGHNPAVIYRASERRTWMLKSPGMGLGLNSGGIFDQSLKVETLQLRQMDKIFFYSDGITEAMNGENEDYGEERLMAAAERTDGLDPEQSRDIVIADVAQFLGPVSPQDDQTLVVMQVL